MCSKPAGDESRPSIELAEGEKRKGNDHFKSGRYNEAVQCYSKAIEYNNEEPTILCNRALTYLKLSKYEFAKLDCDCAIRLDPNCVKAFYRRGLAYSGLSDPLRAKQDFLRVLKLEPNNRDAKTQIEALKTSAVSQTPPKPAEDIIQHNTENSLRVSPVKNPPNGWRDRPTVRIAIKSIPDDRFCSTEPAKHMEMNAETSIRVVKESVEESSEPITIPRTSVEFFTRWRGLKASNQQRLMARYFMAIPVDSYQRLLERMLDGDILADFINCINIAMENPTVRTDADTFINMLLALTRVERFSVAVAFLEDESRQTLHRLLERIAKCSSNPPGQCETIKSLMNEFELLKV